MTYPALTIEARGDGSYRLHHPLWGEWWMIVKADGEVETHRGKEKPSRMFFIPSEDPDA